VKPSASHPKLNPKLIIVSAPSGAGKTTLCERLIQEFPEITLSISTTTRARRPNEEEGVHYFYVTKEVFKKKIAEKMFAEWAEVHENLYGTSRETIDKALNAGRPVLFDIDVQGALNLKKQYGDKAVLIFIHPPSMEALKERLLKRKSDSLVSIETRLTNAYNEIQWSPKFDHQIVNEDLEKAYALLKKLVEKECQ